MLQTVDQIAERLNALAYGMGRGTDAKHRGEIRTVDIAIEHADGITELRKTYAQVDGNCAFAHAAFAGTNGNDVLNTRNRQFWLFAWRLRTHIFRC